MVGKPRARDERVALVMVAFVGFALSLPMSAAGERRKQSAESKDAVQFPLTRVYDQELGDDEKRQAVAATVTIFADLGIELRHASSDVTAAVTASKGKLEAKAIGDIADVYDGVYYVTSLARLPSSLFPLYPRILLVKNLKARDARRDRMRSVPLAFESDTGSILIDHANLNMLETFGRYMHPKINYAMVLEMAVEARLRELGPAALRELGLDVVVDDDEWVRLNGVDDGWSRYTGEELAFVGLKTTLRVTPPGILLDAIREAKTGVPTDAYAGLPEANHPWWSPRHSPASERQSVMRCMFSRSRRFFHRLGGVGGIRADRVLREKTRLILYAAFVASGGVLDQTFWTRRHPSTNVVAELTRDFDADLLAQINARLAANVETSGVRIAPLKRQTPRPR